MDNIAGNYIDMIQPREGILSRFFVAGINYKKTETPVRGQFSINDQQYENVLELAPSIGVDELFILSTCNRTEVYGIAENASQLLELLCSQTAGSSSTFHSLCYVKQGADAIDHLFNVGAGIDSQILGDYEIIAQIKAAIKFSKERGCIGGFIERLVNNVLQSTKAIKNQTALSSGTVSVSFAAVQYLKERFGSVQNKKVVLLGVGKIGSNTCKNLKDYLDCTNITLINRTAEKAMGLAISLDLQHASYDEMIPHIQAADIILVATGANKPILLKSHIEGFGAKVIIDLSVPYNVEPAVKDLPGITLVNIDELSKIQDETYQKRLAEVPKAKAIIANQIAEFHAWLEMRKKITFIKAAKQRALDLRQDIAFKTTYSTPDSAAIHRSLYPSIDTTLKNLLTRRGSTNEPGCTYLEAINNFLVMGTLMTR